MESSACPWILTASDILSASKSFVLSLILCLCTDLHMIDFIEMSYYSTHSEVLLEMHSLSNLVASSLAE